MNARDRRWLRRWVSRQVGEEVSIDAALCVWGVARHLGFDLQRARMQVAACQELSRYLLCIDRSRQVKAAAQPQER